MFTPGRWLCVGAVALGVPLTAQAQFGKHLEDPCRNIPPGVQPAPPGAYVNQFIHVQAAKAETDDFVLYKHMWYRGGTELGPLGRYQLDLISRRLATVPFPVVIETSKDDKLDTQRRDVIIQLLQARGFTDPDRVIVAYPIAEGMFGDEAPRVYNGIINIGTPGTGLGNGAGFNPFFGGLPGLGVNGPGGTPLFNGLGGFNGIGGLGTLGGFPGAGGFNISPGVLGNGVFR